MISVRRNVAARSKIEPAKKLDLWCSESAKMHACSIRELWLSASTRSPSIAAIFSRRSGRRKSTRRVSSSAPNRSVETIDSWWIRSRRSPDSEKCSVTSRARITAKPEIVNLSGGSARVSSSRSITSERIRARSPSGSAGRSPDTLTSVKRESKSIVK